MEETEHTPLRDGAHTNILAAYLSRLTPADMQTITEAAHACSYAGANLGNSSQLSAHEQLIIAIHTAIERMLEHDKLLINKAILRETEESEVVRETSSDHNTRPRA